MTKFSRIAVLCTLVTPLVARSIAAQQTDSLLPRHSAWGAEVIPTSSGGAILRFTSPRRAWVAGFDVGAQHQDQPSSPFNRSGSTNSQFRAQLGHRWYLAAMDDNAGHLRPTVGLGLVGTMYRTDSGDNFDHQWMGGGYAEVGATWFFSPHFSLGAVSMLQATKGRQRRTETGVAVDGTAFRTTSTTNVWYASANLTRVLAAVYF